MIFDWVYYTLAVVLVLLCCGAWVATALSLPGNWGIVLLAAAFAWYPSQPEGPGVAWITVIVVAALAVAGEVLESMAGAAGAVKLGASRRSVILSLAGAVVGSIAGASVLAPVPVIGLPLGAVGGGAVGAFCGALAGELWKGKHGAEAVAVGKAAFTGRLWGTAGKLVIGAVMVLLVAIDAFVN